MQLDARHAKSMVRTKTEQGQFWRKVTLISPPLELVSMGDIKLPGRRICPGERMEIKACIALIEERDIAAEIAKTKGENHALLKLCGKFLASTVVGLGGIIVADSSLILGVPLVILGLVGVIYYSHAANYEPMIPKRVRLMHIKGCTEAIGIIGETRDLVVRALNIRKELVATVQGMPLDLETKGRLLLMLSGRTDSLETGLRVRSILEGVKRRDEDSESFSKTVLPNLLQKLDSTDALLGEARKDAEGSRKEEAEGKCLEAAEAYEGVSDWHMAAEAYALVSGVVLEGKRDWAEALARKAADCEMKAGDGRAAEVHNEWAKSLSGEAVRELPAQGTAAE
jgi:hypothetical protein